MGLRAARGVSSLAGVEFWTPSPVLDNYRAATQPRSPIREIAAANKALPSWPRRIEDKEHATRYLDLQVNRQVLAAQLQTGEQEVSRQLKMGSSKRELIEQLENGIERLRERTPSGF